MCNVRNVLSELDSTPTEVSHHNNDSLNVTSATLSDSSSVSYFITLQHDCCQQRRALSLTLTDFSVDSFMRSVASK